MSYNSLFVNYENSFQLRTYQFTVKSDFQNELDKYDVFTEKEKNDNSFDVVENEIDSAFAQFDDKYHFDDHSAYVSINRSKNKIFYLSRSNDWNGGYFVTLTIDPKKYDSKNYDVVSDLVRRFVKNLKYYDSNVRCLIVPEKHKSGCFHFHGLVKGDIKDALVDSGHRFNDRVVFNFSRCWSFGFSNVQKVENTLAVEKYITKYSTKELLNDLKYQHRYFQSNLKNADMNRFFIHPDFINDMLLELSSSDCVLNVNSDGLYNRCTYTELKKCDLSLQIILKYSNMTMALLNKQTD